MFFYISYNVGWGFGVIILILIEVEDFSGVSRVLGEVVVSDFFGFLGVVIEIVLRF